MNDDLVELTAQIVTSHLGGNRVNLVDVPVLIRNVHSALTELGKPTPIPAIAPEPAVSIRASIKPDAITCLECGAKQKMLKRHLSPAHSLAVDQYRAKWELPSNYPMVAPNYAEQRKELALRIGLGKKPGVQPASRRKRT